MDVAACGKKHEPQIDEQGAQNGEVDPKVVDSFATNSTNQHECPIVFIRADSCYSWLENLRRCCRDTPHSSPLSFDILRFLVGHSAVHLPRGFSWNRIYSDRSFRRKCMLIERSRFGWTRRRPAGCWFKDSPEWNHRCSSRTPTVCGK